MLLAILGTQVVTAEEESFNGAKFEQIWKSTTVLGTSTYLEEWPDGANQGYGVNDKFYINLNFAEKILAHDRNDFTGEEIETYHHEDGSWNDPAFTHDEAGNWIIRVRNQQYALEPNLDEFLIIKADNSDRRLLQLPESVVPYSPGNGMMYFGTAEGDFFSPEGGRIVFTGAFDGIYVIKIRNGEIVEEESFKASFEKVVGHVNDSWILSTEAYVSAWRAADGTVHYLYVNRHDNPIDMTLDEENHVFKGVFIDVERQMPTGYVRGQNNGFSMFSMGGRNYMVLPAVPNFLDGFHVIEVNVEDGTFVHKAYHKNDYPKEPAGYYEYEGIYCNWLNGEVINDTTAYVYQYFPWGYFAKYKFVDPIEETPLEYIVNEGEEDNTYTIADDIIAVYIAEKEPTRLYAKDLGKHRFPSVKGDGEVDYVMDKAHLQTDVWDQSNWVLLDFDTELEARQFLSSSKGVIAGGTLTGVLTEKLNPTMTVTSYKVPTQWTGYDENKHVTANYMDPLVQQGATGNKYFFVEPKAQEYVMIYWAKYDGHESYHFRVPDGVDANGRPANLEGLAGGFKVDWSLYPGNYLEDFIEGHTYNFHAIIRYTADHHGVLGGGDEPSGAPRRDGEDVREGDYIVYPLEGGDEALTAVDEVWSDLEPVEVTYVNMLGMQSATPFDGMNIVVTRYSNGMITAIKVMR